ncbi:MAG: nucleotidyltransferase family protein [Syntrophorhabdaceae bacterium]|nr:nucleotidyltransferase family protein [Syntrophorhabdaceae bacterium]
MKIYAAVLASGISKRLGFNKLTLKIDGKSVIKRAVEPFLIEELERVFVIVNPEGKRVVEELEGLSNGSPPLSVVVNHDFKKGMSSSIIAVLPHIMDGDGLLIHLGDKPFLKGETVKSIIETFLREEGMLVVPKYMGIKGHPVMIRVKPYFSELEGLKGDMGLREIMDKHMKDMLSIEGDEGCILDIDTVETIDMLKERGHKIEKGKG